jgi:hypothetical protein
MADVPEKRVTVRCAVYTRKSTEEGLDQEFNSLQAQREAADVHIKERTPLPGPYPLLCEGRFCRCTL